MSQRLLTLAVCSLTAVAVVLTSCAPAPTPSPTSPPAKAAAPAAPAEQKVPAPAPKAEPAAAKPAAPKTLAKIDFMMPWIPPTEYSYFIMAQEKGFYAAEGLEVALHEGTGSGNTVKVVGAGTMPIGLADANRILAGRVQGVPVTSVMSLYYTSPVLVISLKDKGITKLEHLIGKKVGEAPDAANILIWRAAMTKAGLDYNKVNLVSLDPAAKIPALVSGQVEAILGQTQPADLEAEGVKVDVVPVDLDVVADSLLVNDSFLQKDAETVRAFLRAFLKGVDYVKKNEAETLQAMAKRFPTVDPKKLELRQKLEATWVWTKTTPQDKFGLQHITSWKNLQDLMFETNQIDKKVEIESFVKNDFLPYN
jgi:NitT/TauT family transport system substrate-binding protein